MSAWFLDSELSTSLFLPTRNLFGKHNFYQLLGKVAKAIFPAMQGETSPI